MLARSHFLGQLHTEPLGARCCGERSWAIRCFRQIDAITETRTQASMTIPLSRIRSRTSMSLAPPSRVKGILFLFASISLGKKEDESLGCRSLGLLLLCATRRRPEGMKPEVLPRRHFTAKNLAKLLRKFLPRKPVVHVHAALRCKFSNSGCHDC